ncbi:MAG: hypothetical protein ACP5VR_01710 [Acidimicrobiales bacterium]
MLADLVPGRARQPARAPTGRRSAGHASLRSRWAGKLAEALFPEAPGRTPWPRPLVAGGYALGLAGLASTALLRQTGVPATQTMWAEDGVVFYSDAMARSLWWSLGAAYNGYGQLFPRLAVQLVHLAPLRDASTVIALCGAASLALLGCLVFHMARGHIPSPALRAVLVAAMVLLPVASVEMLDNLVNTPWWLLFAAFWALLWRPTHPLGKLVAAVVCLLAVGSEPLAGLLLPLVVARVVALPRAKEQAASVGFALGLGYQAAIVLANGGERSFTSASWTGVPQAFAVRVGLEWLVGYQGTGGLYSHERALATGAGVALLAAVLLLGLAAPSWRPRQRPRPGPSVRAFTMAAFVCAAACFVVPVWLRDAGPLMQVDGYGYAGRYEAAPVLMVLSVLLVVAGTLGTSSLPAPSKRPAGLHARHDVGQRGPSGTAGAPEGASANAWWPALACTLLLAPGWAVGLRTPNGRSDGPTWQSQLAAARARCAEPKPPAFAQIEVDPPGHFILLACRDVVAPRR